MIRPTRDLLVVKSLPLTRDLKIGMIFVPEIGQVAPRQGTVQAVGPRCRDVSPGDRVIFSKHSGSYVSHDRERLLVMKESDVIAVIG